MRVYTMQSGGQGGVQKWSANGQYVHFILSRSTKKTMPVGCRKMRWQSNMDRRCKEAEHLPSINIYRDPIGNPTYTALQFAHTVNRHVVPNQTAKIQLAEATLNL